MNNTFVGFLLGAVAGSVAAWFILDKKYKTQAQEEIDSVKEFYQNRLKESKSDEEPETQDECEDEIDDGENGLDDEDYEALLQQCSYVQYSKSTKTKEKGEEKDMSDKKPYVISPDEFAELDDYEVATLYYYADGTLTDEADNVIEDVEETVGRGSLIRFGEYEADSVFVRNERLECDFEILRDERTYAETVNACSHPEED